MRALSPHSLLISALSFLLLATACGEPALLGPGPSDSPSELRITPESTTVSVGATIKLVAIDGANSLPLDASDVEWVSEDTTIAIVSGSGFVTALKRGETSVRGSTKGRSERAKIKVRGTPVSGVSVSPVSTEISVGASVQLDAAVTDGSGAEVPGASITWASSAPEVASVSEAGLVTGGRPGTARIAASAGGITAEAEVAVVSAAVASISIEPDEVSLATGESFSLRATPRDASGAALSGRSISWSSSDPAVASVTSAGVVSGAGTGSAEITATSEGKHATASVTVSAESAPVASVVVSPSSASLEVGETATLRATPRDAEGQALAERVVTWSSSNSAVATVSSSGSVRAAGPGTATISASSEGKTGTARIEVAATEVPVATVSVTPSSPSLEPGETAQLTAVARDGSGNVLEGRVFSWVSADPSTVTVSSSGVVTAREAGDANVTATTGGVAGAAHITVEPAPVATIVVSPGSLALEVGETGALSATLRDADGGTLAGRSVSWSSSNSSVASVSSTGAVTARAAGSATITASSEGRSDNASVTVTATEEPAPPATPRAGYHVSPSGSSGGDGSSSRPWDLATALTRTVAGGDTIWLHGGTYRGRFVSWLNGRSGAPIVVRQYPGERATIDGQLIVVGSYTTFWGFEVMSSTSGPGDVEGVTVKGPGTRFINMVVHDHGGNGFGFWSEAPNSEIYGSLIYNNGRQRVIPNFAHGIYGQNATGTKRVVDNIVFNQFGYGLHFYADAGGLRNLHIEGNTVFQNGAPASRRGAPNLLIGGGTAAGGAQVLDNMIYATTNEGTNVWLGHGLVQQNDDVVLRGNYIVGGSPALRMRRWTQATVSNNTFVGYAELVNIFGGYQGYNWAANHHYRQTSAYAWTVNDITGTFSEWRSRTGLGSSDATTGGQPSGTKVVVRPNQYEPGRANVTIYNWSGQAGVSVDLSQVLTPGQRYEVRNAQNFFGTPVFSGTYAGGAVSFPMTGVTPPQPVGGWISAPPRTCPQFDAFVVLRVQ